MVITGQVEQAVNDQFSQAVVQGVVVFLGFASGGVDSDKDIAQLRLRNHKAVIGLGCRKGEDISRSLLLAILFVVACHFRIAHQYDTDFGRIEFEQVQQMVTALLQKSAVERVGGDIGSKAEVNGHGLG